MRAHDAAPVGGTTGHGKIDGGAKRIQRCGSCAKPSTEHFCPQCLADFPMLRWLMPRKAVRA